VALAITQLKKGTLFQLDGVPYKVLEYSQKVMGRGGSIVNVRIKSLSDGRVLDKTFKGNEQLEPANVTTKNVQYLYSDTGRYHFMDTVTYEQFSVGNELLSDQASYLKEGDEVKAQLWREQIVSLELPKNVYLTVTYTEHAVKGDTSSAVTKNATLETGLVVKVPGFIKTGDVISVDTTSGAYRERKKA
jgi:elongation factor P